MTHVKHPDACLQLPFICGIRAGAVGKIAHNDNIAHEHRVDKKLSLRRRASLDHNSKDLVSLDGCKFIG